MLWPAAPSSSAGDGTAASLSSAFAVGDTLTVNGKTLTFVAANTAGNDPNSIKIDSDVTSLLAQDRRPDRLVDGLDHHWRQDHAEHRHAETTCRSAAATLRLSRALGLAGGVTQARTQVPGVSGRQDPEDRRDRRRHCHRHRVRCGSRPRLLAQPVERCARRQQPAGHFTSSGKLTITTTNDAASATIGAITGSAVGASQAFAAGTTAPAPVVDASAKLTRDNLVAQYNNIIDQITTTSQDASFNGVNLLGGDTLKLTFNETGKSTLSIQGVNFNPAGLGLDVLGTGATSRTTLRSTTS